MAPYLVALLALLPVVCVASMTPAAPMDRSPCPRRQLLGYVSHAAGRGGSGGAVVYACAAESILEQWQPVGRVAAGTAEAEDDSLEGIIRAVQFQRRLIAEHACRLNKDLISAKRGAGITLGVEDPDGGIMLVPPSAPGDPSVQQMLECGFFGTPAGRGIYQSFGEDGGNRAYDRKAVRAELEAAATSDTCVVFAWPRCGFATTARGMLAERGVAFTDVVLEKFSPQHAELALLTGRPSVPCIYLDGALVGGCNEDVSHPGLLKALEKREDTLDDRPPRRTVPVMLAALPEVEELCDGCFFRCDGCAWAWTDEEFLEEGGPISVLRQRDAEARAALGMEPLADDCASEPNATALQAKCD